MQYFIVEISPKVFDSKNDKPHRNKKIQEIPWDWIGANMNITIEPVS